MLNLSRIFVVGFFLSRWFDWRCFQWTQKWWCYCCDMLIRDSRHLNSEKLLLVLLTNAWDLNAKEERERKRQNLFIILKTNKILYKIYTETISSGIFFISINKYYRSQNMHIKNDNDDEWWARKQNDTENQKIYYGIKRRRKMNNDGNSNVGMFQAVRAHALILLFSLVHRWSEKSSAQRSTEIISYLLFVKRVDLYK